MSFLFREIMGRDDVTRFARAKGPHDQPLVLSHREVLRVLEQLRGKFFLIAVLLYSAGLRLEECLRLRIKDIDFELRQIFIRDGKGQKDRYVALSQRAAELLRAQIAQAAELHRNDRALGHGWAMLPSALHRKDPSAGHDIGWQFIFPASSINRDPATGRTGRWPLHATAIQRQVKGAVRRSGIIKRASCHTFRHSLPPKLCAGAATSERSSTSWVTKTSEPPWSICTLSSRQVSTCGVRWIAPTWTMNPPPIRRCARSCPPLCNGTSPLANGRPRATLTAPSAMPRRARPRAPAMMCESRHNQPRTHKTVGPSHTRRGRFGDGTMRISLPQRARTRRDYPADAHSLGRNYTAVISFGRRGISLRPAELVSAR